MEQRSEKRYRLYILTSILALTLSTFNLVTASNVTKERVHDDFIYISANADSDSLKATLLDTANNSMCDQSMKKHRNDNGLTGI